MGMRRIDLGITILKWLGILIIIVGVLAVVLSWQ